MIRRWSWTCPESWCLLDVAEVGRPFTRYFQQMGRVICRPAFVSVAAEEARRNELFGAHSVSRSRVSVLPGGRARTSASTPPLPCSAWRSLRTSHREGGALDRQRVLRFRCCRPDQLRVRCGGTCRLSCHRWFRCPGPFRGSQRPRGRVTDRPAPRLRADRGNVPRHCPEETCPRRRGLVPHRCSGRP